MGESTTFGANLRAARDAAHLTQEDIASKLGFTRTTPVSLWERSPHLPEPETIIKLAAAVGCSPASLLHGVVTPYDTLRGYTVTVPLDDALQATSPDVHGLSPVEARLIDHLRRLPGVLVMRFATLIEEAARYAAPGSTTSAPDARYRRGSPHTPAAAPRAGGKAGRRPRRAS